jgi:hypothetical protein
VENNQYKGEELSYIKYYQGFRPMFLYVPDDTFVDVIEDGFLSHYSKKNIKVFEASWSSETLNFKYCDSFDSLKFRKDRIIEWISSCKDGKARV